MIINFFRSLIYRVNSGLILLGAAGWVFPSLAQTEGTVSETGSEPALAPIAYLHESVAKLLAEGIEAQKRAGYPDYSPRYAYVLDPSIQEMVVVHAASGDVVLKLSVGTGTGGLGFGSSQTPVGFFTMGGVRIARNASAYIQTGDSKTGISGIYAEILYPPSHPVSRLRGRVPNNVIIHGFNPSASSAMRERHERGLIGRAPCTTGCPTPAVKDLPSLAPYLKLSAGSFDPDAEPNSTLRSLISRGEVEEFSREELGDPILILDRPFRR